MGDTKEVHYFSNGTEWEIWSYNWCERCDNDHCTHNADPRYEDGCKWLPLAMVHEEVPVWVYTDWDEYGPTNLHCLDFRPCPCNPDDGDGPGYYSGPPKVGPGQLLMFDVPEHPRMYRDTVLDVLTPEPV